MLLSHTQFIENRVYDEDDEEQSTLKDDETNSKLNGNMKGDMKNDKDPEEEFSENVTMALQSSFDFVDESFHQVEVGDIWSKHESKNLLPNRLVCQNMIWVFTHFNHTLFLIEFTNA